MQNPLAKINWGFILKSEMIGASKQIPMSHRGQVATQHLSTGFTKIISVLRSVSILHQLLMNIFIFI